MKTQRAYLFLTLVLVLVMVSSCRQNIPGSQAPGEEVSGTAETAGTEMPVASQMYIFATQTALATQGAAPVGTVQPGGPEAPGETLVAPTQEMPTQAVVAPTQPQPIAPQQPAVIATAPPLVVPDSYTLQTGEFPFCIARRFNIDPGALLRVNGLSSYSVYYAGMTLRIPKGVGGFPGNRALINHPTSYSVRGGETLYTIACAFGDVDPNAIAVVNNLTPPYRLAPGTVLQIP